MAIVLPAALIVVLLIAAWIFKLSNRDLAALGQRLASGRHGASIEAQAGLVGQADRALATVDQAVREFDQAAEKVSRIDEAEEDRDAA